MQSRPTSHALFTKVHALFCTQSHSEVYVIEGPCLKSLITYFPRYFVDLDPPHQTPLSQFVQRQLDENQFHWPLAEMNENLVCSTIRMKSTLIHMNIAALVFPAMSIRNNHYDHLMLVVNHYLRSGGNVNTECILEQLFYLHITPEDVESFRQLFQSLIDAGLALNSPNFHLIRPGNQITLYPKLMELFLSGRADQKFNFRGPSDIQSISFLESIPISVLKLWRAYDAFNSFGIPAFACVNAPRAVALLESGLASVNWTTKGGDSSLAYALSADVMQCLLDRGVDVNHRNKEGNTGLHRRLDRHHRPDEGIRLLIQSGRLNANIVNSAGETYLHKFAALLVHIRYSAQDKEIALKLMEDLLERGANPRLKDGEGFTVMDRLLDACDARLADDVCDRNTLRLINRALRLLMGYDVMTASSSD